MQEAVHTVLVFAALNNRCVANKMMWRCKGDGLCVEMERDEAELADIA